VLEPFLLARFGIAEVKAPTAVLAEKMQSIAREVHPDITVFDELSDMPF
jgi:hypothetical protein